MTVVADQYTHVVGVDTHARTHTYVIVQATTGRQVAEEVFPTSAARIRRAIAWMGRTAPGPLLAAVECTSTYGATLDAALTDVGVRTVEARPPARAGRRSGKSDPVDARAAAMSVLGADAALLTTPRRGKSRSALRVLLAARHSMDARRTAARNALTALLRQIPLGIDARHALTNAQIHQVAGWRDRAGDDIEQATARAEATRLADEEMAMTEQLARNKQRLTELDRTLAPALLDTRGVGPVTAAIFLTAWSHPGRVRSEAAFASLAGVAPIPASSGNTIRYRLNRHGDRQLNRALNIVARSRMMTDPETIAYAHRRRTEGKTDREILRILKRYIARQIHRQLTRACATTATTASTATTRPTQGNPTTAMNSRPTAENEPVA